MFPVFASRTSQTARTAGPGLLEACVWILCLLFAQALAAAACILLLVVSAYGRWPNDAEAAVNLLLDINLDSDFMLIGVAQLGALFLIVPAVRLRLGRNFRERLQWRRPDTRMLLLTVGAVVPLAVLSRRLLDVAVIQWQHFSAGVPALQQLNDANALEAIADRTAGVPFAILVIALALGPALGEEIIFRGLIGPGLIRRWGVWAGVVITSVLFAGVHGFPPHAIATLPLAFFLHYALLKTGSLWTPIVLHFLNNSLAVAMLKFPLLTRLPDSPMVVAAAALYVLAVASLLGTTAHRDLEAATVEADGGWPWRLRWFDAVAGGCIVAFTTTFVWSAIAG
ncbi:MAG: CPBP family intramembrane metalloprotease [Planctomycetaceae bacterium]|nr:CPBP family intramembrane metalloprotease [Planctomycetaceae bacterium]